MTSWSARELDAGIIDRESVFAGAAVVFGSNSTVQTYETVHGMATRGTVSGTATATNAISPPEAMTTAIDLLIDGEVVVPR